MTDSGRWDVSEDAAVDDFVDRCVTTFASWDLIIYMLKNPDICATRARLAALLGRQESDMVHALDLLVSEGVLDTREDAEGQGCFALTTDDETRDLVRRFIRLAERREHRLEYVRRVLANISLP